jgi:hypothetical protein
MRLFLLSSAQRARVAAVQQLTARPWKICQTFAARLRICNPKIMGEYARGDDQFLPHGDSTPPIDRMAFYIASGASGAMVAKLC